MIDHIQQALFSLNAYSISFLVIAVLFVLTSLSLTIKQSITTPLYYLVVVWTIFFGFKVFTGNDLHQEVSALLSGEEESRYEKVTIDGREVIYDKYTNEVVKPSKE